MRDLQFRLLSSRQRVHGDEVWGLKMRRGDGSHLLILKNPISKMLLTRLSSPSGA